MTALWQPHYRPQDHSGGKYPGFRYFAQGSSTDLSHFIVISIRVLDTPSYFDQIWRQSRLWLSKTFDHCRPLEKRGTVRTSDISVQKRMILCWVKIYPFFSWSTSNLYQLLREIQEIYDIRKFWTFYKLFCFVLFLSSTSYVVLPLVASCIPYTFWVFSHQSGKRSNHWLGGY